jgi:glycine dehydrogenase subunit 2
MAATVEQIERKTLGKVRPHQTQNEGLVFEKSAPGKRGYKMPPLDVPEVDAKTLLGSAYREEKAGLPELSEIEIIRHFTRLSTWNYAIDLGMYPLGSCTMKYNPRVNEFVARIEGLAEAHPYRPRESCWCVVGMSPVGMRDGRSLFPTRRTGRIRRQRRSVATRWRT